MGSVNPSLVLLGTLVLLLLSCGIEDARGRTIANWKNAAIALLAPAWWWAQGFGLWPDAAIQLGIAIVVFALFCAAFAYGQMGGGDVKLIGALALWLPFQPLLNTLLVMSLAGGVLTLLMVAERAWRKRQGQLEIPYGVAIVFAALLAVREPIINQFG